MCTRTKIEKVFLMFPWEIYFSCFQGQLFYTDFLQIVSCRQLICFYIFTGKEKRADTEANEMHENETKQGPCTEEGNPSVN